MVIQLSYSWISSWLYAIVIQSRGTVLMLQISSAERIRWQIV